MYEITLLSKIKSHSDVIDDFKEFLFYNKPIEKPVKRLKNIDQLPKLPSVIKTDQALKGYATSYKVERVERKDPIVQLEASKLSLLTNLLSDLLNETKGFKYQITVEVLLKNTSIIEKLNLDRFILIQ